MSECASKPALLTRRAPTLFGGDWHRRGGKLGQQNASLFFGFQAVGVLHRPEAADQFVQLRYGHCDLEAIRPKRRDYGTEVANILPDQRSLRPPLLLPAERVERRAAKVLAVLQHAEQWQCNPALQ